MQQEVVDDGTLPILQSVGVDTVVDSRDTLALQSVVVGKVAGPRGVRS